MKNDTSKTAIDKDSKTRTHWKNLFDYKYLGAQDFEEENGKYKDMILTIKRIYLDEVEGERGPKICTLFEFEEDVSPMIVNKVNFKMIEKILKTSFVEDFIAKKIQLFILKNYKAFGNIHNVIRVRPFAPKLTKPKLQKTEFKNAVSNYLKFGNLDKVKEFRTISEAQEKEIIKLAKKESNE